MQLAYQGEVEVVHVGSRDCGGLPEAVRRWVGDAEVGGVCARGGVGAAAAREYGWVRDRARGEEGDGEGVRLFAVKGALSCFALGLVVALLFMAASISGSRTIKKKWCVWLLYGSPCAPLLLPWLGEVQGTSLVMIQGKYSPVPVPALIPMFRVPPRPYGCRRRRPRQHP